MRKLDAATRRSAGRPRADPEVASFVNHTKQEEDKEIDRLKLGQKRKRGTYTNWFAPNLCPSIYSAVTRHRSSFAARNHVGAYQKTPGQVCSPYDKLSRGSLADWFKPHGVLEEKFKQAINKGTTSLILERNHLTIMERHPHPRDEIYNVMRRIWGWRSTFGRTFSAADQTRSYRTQRQPELLAESSLPRRFKVNVH